MSDIKQVQQEIEKIKARNNKVELDKKWEKSITRKSSILIFTYITMSIFMHAIKVEAPFINAIIPTLGFWLSTLSLPAIKSIWLKTQNND